MKNLFILPTNKPTRLFTADSEIRLAGYPKTTFKTGKNIYVTNSEEIKERNYALALDTNTVFKVSESDLRAVKKFPHLYKKIILTDNEDLIKDGVQAIDDEFLEWFVKNPSCEKVEVNKIESFDFEINKYVYNYKIIIPRTTQQIIDEDFASGLDMGQISAKQESKQDRTCNNNCSTICGECQIFEFRPISGLEWLLGYIEELNKKGYKFIPSSKKEIVEHVTQMEKDNMINFLKSVFQQDNFDYEKAYNEFLTKK
jgi:hypothetical protein